MYRLQKKRKKVRTYIPLPLSLRDRDRNRDRLSVCILYPVCCIPGPTRLRPVYQASGELVKTSDHTGTEYRSSLLVTIYSTLLTLQVSCITPTVEYRIFHIKALTQLCFARPHSPPLTFHTWLFQNQQKSNELIHDLCPRPHIVTGC